MKQFNVSENKPWSLI